MNTPRHNLWLTGAVLGLLSVPGWSAADPSATRTNPIGMEYAEAVQPGVPGAQPDAAPQTPIQPPRAAETIPEESAIEMTSSLYSASPAELQDRQVLGNDGEKLGRITHIVSDRRSNQVYVIIASGGFLGLGASEHAVPLDSLDRIENQLHLPLTKDELAQREKYQPEEFVAVQPADRPISEFSAFEAVE